MKTLFALRGILAVAAAIVLIGAPAAYAASTLYVNAATGTDSPTCGASTSPCRTIQQAVDNASPGDAIQVASGTYDESVSIDKSLTLDGAQAGNPGTAARAGSPGAESVVSGGTVDIAASGVTLDGFSFDYAGNQVCLACFNATVGSASAVTIEDNVFSGYQLDCHGDWCAGNAIGVNAAPDTQITRNYFTSPGVDFGDNGGAVAQWFDGGCSGADVSDNVFDNADASALADIYFYCDDQPVSTITVSGNQDTIGGDASFVNFQHIGGSGAQLVVTDNRITMTPASGSSGLYFSSHESGVGTVTVSGNSLTGDPFRAVKLSTNAELSGQVDITGNDLSGNGVGIYVGANSLSAGASLTVDDNDLSGETGDNAAPLPDPGAGVYIAPGAEIPASITAAGNDLSGDWAGVYVGGVDQFGRPAPALAPGATVRLRANDLAGELGGTFQPVRSPYVTPQPVPRDGVYNDPNSGGSVDAVDNWWGCNAGPGQTGCSSITGAVTFDPWLVLGISASPSTLVAPGSSTVTADVTRDSVGNDTSGSGTIPDGTTIAFATDFGVLSASSAGTSGGKASVTLSSATQGTAHVSATLDAQTVSTTVTFTAPPRPTSADQCKAGGWQSYGIFKNQGDCVSYVATQGKNPPGK